MPESVFGIQLTVFKYCVFNVLERIFALHFQIMKIQVLGTHHKIFALRGAVLHIQFLHGPSEFRRINIAAFHDNIAAFSEGFNSMKLCVCDLHMVGIPQSRTAKGSHLRICDLQTMVMPEGITQIAEAVFHVNITALF